MEHKTAVKNQMGSSSVRQAAIRGAEIPDAHQMQSQIGNQATIQAMESRMGADFSGVRVQEGNQSSELGASAYATGQKIHFAAQPAQPFPAHEAAHVVQQSGNRSPGSKLPGYGVEA